MFKCMLINLLKDFKNDKKISILKVSTFLLFLFSDAKAGIFDEYLEDIEIKFNQASTLEKKFEVISHPINIEYLKKASALKDLEESQLAAGVSSDPITLMVEERKGFNFDKTTPLSLAVSLGKARLVKEFLKAVPNVNDIRLTAWGYRQPYTLAHMALHPKYPNVSHFVPLEDRLVIIDALGKKGTDFNAIIMCHHVGVYENPPLAAGTGEGTVKPTDPYPLQARALLYGADPSLRGSSFSGIPLKYGHSSYRSNGLTRECLKQYLEKISLGEIISPLPPVLIHLKGLAEELGFNLEELEILSLTRQKISLAYEKNAAQIAKLKSRKTKKAKRKVSHLQQVHQEFEVDLAKLNKRIANFLKTSQNKLI